ncbi:MULTISPECIES: helix-turn-helix domain-containing protein [unclassified Paraburkholderia]|uniref:helix-turn-helix domain-containing protein n=2 Tax=Paraburkholderia TaxID=1822464 RepID=UPI0017CFE111|nr:MULTISPECIES: AraC family transcriptional regulator [unclassified Paraburkholderia]MBB5411468.1 hypothetical protein [Paraburkholderia sp. HC6.4b]MBB5450002.1 hypothetical protein [Paraburkholderia sp. Kb1A]
MRSFLCESTVERAYRCVQCLRKILYGYRLRNILFKIVARFSHDGTVMKCAECPVFQLVKDGLRRDIAVHRLTNSNTSVAVPAFDLGFSDATGFCRAFKHWTGSSPFDYRKSTRQGE